MVGGCRRDCTTTVSHGVVSWERGLSRRDTTRLPFISLPMGQHKNPEAEVSHLPPLLPGTLLGCVSLRADAGMPSL